jgi:hypothetical protein
MPAAITEKEWRRRAREIHGKTYDYSKMVWRGQSAPVTLICKVHGEFQVYAKFHTLNKCGCRACGLAKPRKYTTDSFIEKARKVHGDKYTYEKTRFSHITAKVTITCPKHGDFEQQASNHVNVGAGCYWCGKESASKKIVGHQMQYAKTRTVVLDNKPYVIQSSSELVVLEKLLKKYKVRAQNDCPVIEYRKDKRTHNHRPDFYLPKVNRLVEVKSAWTLGVLESQLKSDTFATCKLKVKAAKEQGYHYSVVVVKRGQHVVLPSAWTSWSANKVRRFLDKSFHSGR